MNKFKEELVALRKHIAKTMFKLAETTAVDGTILVYEGDIIEVGMTINTYDESGAQVPVADGSYEVTDFGTVTIANGVVSDIVTPTDVPADQAMEQQGEEPVEQALDVMPMEVPSVDLDAIVEQLLMLEARVTALEAATSTNDTTLSEVNDKVVKMSKHFVEIDDKKTLNDVKLSKSEEAATKAMRYFK